MVRIMIKGGVWKNTEDEILKAAVMKYGKNQWSRVASLLNRKSAKQCKARWFEWLDPSIKKTEWTREEEEKLLHLAKLYPAQWRTLAPIVGRTAAQCMEHYEYLLDAAQAAAAGEEGADEISLAAEARKLRPGEIDPHPETKPARPDPIDMDEDEKEMLAEARARLANTRGKKAKRKAREKQLEEAKRLANLQKKRELKAAGVERKAGQKKRKYVDYKTEIPFQRMVPAGFYAVDEERVASKQLSIEASSKDFEVQRLDQMEGKRRDKEEVEQQRQDRRKMKKMEEANPASIMAQVSKANDPMSYRPRSDLSLPAPLVSDTELEQVLKVGANAMLAEQQQGGDGGSTAGLVGDYASRSVLPTPMRTPRQAGQGHDAVLQEARNQLTMLSQQTPLLGGVNPELAEGTGWEGVQPRNSQAATPNALLAQVGAGGGTPGATPLLGGCGAGFGAGSGGGGGGMTPQSSVGGSTPLRDDLGVNQAGSAQGFVPGGGGRGARSEAQHARHAKAQLSLGLASLPEPQYTYEIEVPATEDDDSASGQGCGRLGAAGGGSAVSLEDAADRDARTAKARAEAEAAEHARRSAAVRKGLPRPGLDKLLSASKGDLKGALLVALGGGQGSSSADSGESAAEGLVRSEMASLLCHDAAQFPFEPSFERSAATAAEAGGDKKEKKRKRKCPSSALAAAVAAAGGAAALLGEVFGDAELAAARLLVAAELAQDADAAAALHLHAGAEGGFSAALGEVMTAVQGEYAFLPERGGFGPLASASAKERLSSLQLSFESARGSMANHAEKCSKLEKKLSVRTRGYEDKAHGLRHDHAQAYSGLDKRAIELDCFRMLAATEAKALPQRVNELYDLSKGAGERNTELQKEYKRLLSERDHFYAALQGNAAGAPAAAAAAAAVATA